MEVDTHVQSIQNRKLVIFLEHIKKNVSELFLCSIVMQKIQIFHGGPVMFIVTCLSLTLNVLTYPLILGKTKTNGLITLSRYPIKYLELVFVSINFGITMLLILTSQLFIVFFAA